MEQAVTISAGDERLSLEYCIAGWLHEKARLSESVKTHTAYQQTLEAFLCAAAARC